MTDRWRDAKKASPGSSFTHGCERVDDLEDQIAELAVASSVSPAQISGGRMRQRRKAWARISAATVKAEDQS